MLIVISSPESIANEAVLINQLFDESMTLFHLRKPNWDENTCEQLIKQIKPEYHNQIAWHQHHDLAKESGSRRLHFSGQLRDQTSPEELKALNADQFILSTSVHFLKEYKELPELFNYAFVSPVFDSISKSGYRSNLEVIKSILSEPKKCERIALGGITAQNAVEVLSWGFDGVATLGSIWKDASKSIDEFKRLKEACHTTVQ